MRKPLVPAHSNSSNSHQHHSQATTSQSIQTRTHPKEYKLKTIRKMIARKEPKTKKKKKKRIKLKINGQLLQERWKMKKGKGPRCGP
jgi:hypothetical protein